MSSKHFLQKVQTGEILVSDGATGTNLLARGLPRGVVAETWLFEKPDAILKLHQDFVEAGADIQFVGELRHSLEDIYLRMIRTEEE